jgi:class 3 adenylate cyclase/tetratricopeptide (TPR) repeat protein
MSEKRWPPSSSGASGPHWATHDGGIAPVACGVRKRDSAASRDFFADTIEFRTPPARWEFHIEPQVAHNGAMAAPLLDRADLRRGEDLVPFLPRLTLQWLRDHPDRRWLELDGTLAFIDISGFTALSERLSGLGKAGAEVLTDVIDSTFAPLLETAYDCGGGLLKFGGDALLLLFSGDDHAPRAARATFEMRGLLRKIGRVRTPAGTANLNMHAGIHSGRLQFFLVGGTHRELLVTGPGATATVAMEGGSEAGEILISPAVAKTLDSRCVGAPREPGLLLRAMPAVAGSLEPLPDAAGVPLEQALPAALRAQLLEVGPLEGEHRQCAVAFIRYQELDALLEREGPEATADALDELVRTVQDAADDHGVTFLQSDIDRDGGKIILVAGAPQTREDNEERLLRTVRAIVDSAPPLPLHVGVSRGRIFAGQVGFSFRRTYTVMGDTVSLAARLMGRAGAGEILVAAEAFERSNGRFAADELEPFAVKGLSVPVRAFSLGALDVAAGPAERTRLPFVGRERERAVLAELAAAARTGNGKLVELVGEAGIGKSRLADELRNRCADMVQLTARCEPYASSTPYHPFRPLLRSLLGVELDGAHHNRRVLAEQLGEIDEELVPWAPLLAAPLDVEVESTQEVDDLDPAFWRARLHAVVSRILAARLSSPTLFVFEDVHWMDDASSELLAYLAARLDACPWLACTTRRPVEGGFNADGAERASALTLGLEPLAVEDGRLLVEAAAGGRALTPDAARALAQRGAGNPLFLQELAAAEANAEELPETVEALLAARIDRLAPGERILLRWASVLGVSFSGSLLAEVLADDSTVQFEIDLAEFVEPDPDVPDGLRFRHTLVREAAYEGLSYRRRRELHGRAGDAIERRHAADPREAAELLSLHFHRAARWVEAWRYSVEAGKRAWAKHANVEAAGFFERAVEIIARVPSVERAEVAGVWELLGDVRMRLAAYERAAEAYGASRRLSRDMPVEQARLMQQEAVARLRLGRYSQALRRLSQALRLLENLSGDTAAAQRARLFSWYANVLQYQRRPSDAIPWCERAIAQAESSGARDALARAYYMLDWAYAGLGRLDEAVYSARAVEIYEDLGDLDRLAWVLNNLGGLTYLTGRWEETVKHAERARATFVKIGDEAAATIAAQNVAEIRFDQGHTEEAGPVFREILPVRRAAGNPLKIAEAASLLGRYAARVRDFEEARALLEEARDLYASANDQTELLATDACLVELLVLEGARKAALTRATEALGRAESLKGVSVTLAALHRLRGWAYMQAGELNEAQAELAESLRLARARDANLGIRSEDYEVALTLDALATLATLAGRPSDELRGQRDAILERLGVVAVPAYPSSSSVRARSAPPARGAP